MLAEGLVTLDSVRTAVAQESVRSTVCLGLVRRIDLLGRSAILFFDPSGMGGCGLRRPVAAYSTLGVSKSTAHENRTFLCPLKDGELGFVPNQGGKSMRSNPVCTSLGWQIITSIPCFTLSATHASRRSGVKGGGKLGRWGVVAQRFCPC